MFYFSVNINITKTLIIAVDLVITALVAFLACFAAAKFTKAAVKIAGWFGKKSLKAKLTNLINKLAGLIVGIIHDVVYTIADTVPKRTLHFATALIADALLDIIDFSPAEALLRLIDRFDGDGKSGVIRFVKY